MTEENKQNNDLDQSEKTCDSSGCKVFKNLGCPLCTLAYMALYPIRLLASFFKK